MYHLQYFNKKTLLKEFQYPTLDDAQDNIQEHDIWNDSTKYKIVDETGDVVVEEEFVTPESMWEGMFDKESEEGFDVDDFFGLD